MGKYEVLKYAAIGLSLLLAACAGDAKRPIDAFFVCGKDVLHTRFAERKLTLTLGATRYDLRQARSGSGARYTGESPDGPVEFWNKGREARLTIGGRTYPTCRQEGPAG